MKRLLTVIVRLIEREDAPTSVEYAIMAGLVAAVVVGGATILGVNTDALFQTALNALGGA